MRKPSNSDFSSWESLLALVAHQVPESSTLDYKQTAYAGPNKPPERRTHERDELRRDVTAFANAGGGWIVIGVTEDDATGCPASLLGVPALREEEARTRDILRERVSPAFGHRVIVRSVPQPESSTAGALVIEIRTADAHRPHGIHRDNGLLEFWKRIDKSKRPMTYGELADAFTPTAEELQTQHIAAISRAHIRGIARDIRSAPRNWERVHESLERLRQHCEDSDVLVRQEIARAAYEAVDYPRAGIPLEIARAAMAILSDALPVHCLVGPQPRAPTPDEVDVLEEAVSACWPLVYDSIRYLNDLPRMWAGTEVLSHLLRFAHLNGLPNLETKATRQLDDAIETARQSRNADAIRLLEYARSDALDPDTPLPDGLHWVVLGHSAK